MTLTGSSLRPPDVCSGGTEYLADELTIRARRAAGALRKLNVNRIGICLPSSWEYIAILFAFWQARMSAVLLSPRLPPADIADKLVRTGASGIITDRTDLEVARIAPGRLLDGPDSAPTGALNSDALATMIFTSGSSTKPKAVMHQLSQHTASANGVIERLSLGPEDRWLMTLPMYHVSGLSVVFRCALARARVVFAENPLYEALVSSRATHVSLVGTQLQQLLHQSAHRPPPSSLKAVIVGGGPISASALAEARKKKWPVCTTYGLTEMASMVTLSEPGINLNISGWPLPRRELNISPEGEILVRGDCLFAGYWEAGDVSLPLDGKGWYHTGDLGRLDAAGRLVVLGRKDDMFISGGENVSPQEIENALMATPGIAMAVVVPAADEVFGLRPVAYVKGEFDEAQVRTQLAEGLPKFKIPELRSWPADVPAAGPKAPRRYFAELARGVF